VNLPKGSNVRDSRTRPEVVASTADRIDAGIGLSDPLFAQSGELIVAPYFAQTLASVIDGSAFIAVVISDSELTSSD